MQDGTIKGFFSGLRTGQRIFVHGQSAVPGALLESLVRQTSPDQELELVHLHLEGIPAHIRPEFRSRFRVRNLFVGPQVRKFMDYDRVDYVPIFLSEIPKLFLSGRCPIDVALVQVSPPDRFGYCTLGISVDIARAAVDSARFVIAQINPRMPRTHGDTLVHRSRIHLFIEVDEPLPEPVHLHECSNETLDAIGRNVASLVEDGATLQMGIGAIPDAVLRSLGDHRHLGIHSEMWSDGVIDLLERGVVDNSRKHVHPGKTVASFAQGTRRLYDFIDGNPSTEFYPSDYVNSPVVIARNPKVMAINSAVQVDLTGQVCADSIGHRLISGVGGQIDFVRGAAMSPGGKSVIAMTSRTRSGISRIVAELNAGAGVVTSRADVHFVVTEYGIADLYGRSLGERAKALIAIAHPDDRELLSAAWNRARAR